MALLPRIAIVGGGLMGAGIAQVFAGAGHAVSVFEPNPDIRNSIRERVAANMRLFQLDESLADKVIATEDLAEAVAGAGYVTEAAPEKLELKQSLFADLVRLAAPDAILASNTSVIPIHLIAAALPSAERIVGTHWWNPPGLIPLVEVVQAAKTSDATIRATMKLLTSIGKSPAHIVKDVPGFVANRLQHALWREAIAMVAEGICDAATLDSCVKNSFGLRLAVLGPLENADLVGLDLTLDIHKIIIPELDRLDGPNPYLESLVAAGKLGFKTGTGFRSWTEEEIRMLRERLAAHLMEARRQRALA
ncbi:MAG: 3-hydroxyacyl-CoA dehydrogenase family protein [Gammaproteobacteria bacterium]